MLLLYLVTQSGNITIHDSYSVEIGECPADFWNAFRLILLKIRTSGGEASGALDDVVIATAGSLGPGLAGVVSATVTFSNPGIEAS